MHHPPQPAGHGEVSVNIPALGPPDARPGPARTGPGDFARRVVVAVLITLVILAVACLLWQGVHVLLEAFAGVLFAIFLAAMADWVQRRTRLSYRWSLAAVVLGLVLVIGGLAYLLWSRLSVQLGELTQTLPRSLEQIRGYLTQYTWGKYLVEKVPHAATGLAEVGSFARVTGFVSGVASFLEAAVVILIVGIFAAAEPDLYRWGLLHLVPPRHRPRAAQAVDAVAFNLRHWLMGQVLVMVVIGITTALGLWLIGIPLAMTLGLLAGILAMVPYVGAWLSAVPAALIALLKGPEYLALTLGLFLLVHVVEGYVLLPLVQRKSVHLPPALALVAQVLMGQLLGVLGLFVAAPLAVAAMALLKMLYVEDTLGDAAVNVPGEPGTEAKPAPAG
jgi:predicted PurR-regulated permease PerM